MKIYAIYGGGCPIAHKIKVADSFFTRFKGLMFRRRLEAGEGLLLKNCSLIHCCFMGFPIDAVYLDSSLRVVGRETVKPWHLGSVFSGAKHVLELEAGGARELCPGMKITWKESTLL